MRKTLLSALVVIALTAQLTGCNRNTPAQQSNESSFVISDVGEPHSSKNSDITQNNNNIPQDMWSVLPEISVTDVSAFKYNYDSNMGGMVITDYLLESPKVRIPDYLENEIVVKVDISECSKQLTELILPDTVTEYSLSNETKNSLQYINIPNMTCYKSMSGLKNLTAVAFGNGVTGIKRNSFSNCPKLTEIYVSDSVSSFAPAAFEGCSKLEKIIYSGNAYSPDEIVNVVNQSNSKSDDDTMESDFKYEDIEDGIKITEYLGSGGDVKIPEKINGKRVICIGTSSFLSKNITGVYIPNGVTEIEDTVFCYCSDLASVAIPDSVTKIGKSAFRGCKSLSNIDIPDDVTEIGDMAFMDCEKLMNIDLPDSLTEIGEMSFYGCFKFTDVNIPYGVTKIGDSAFGKCGNITNVTIPDSVTYIGSAFADCYQLSSVTIPDSVTVLSSVAFNGRYTRVIYKGKTYYDKWDVITKKYKGDWDELLSQFERP